jgi:Uma2 family endonuclease
MSIALEPETEARLPDRYEVVNGEIVRRPILNAYASEVANRIRDALASFGFATELGRTRMGMLFQIPLACDPGRCRMPTLSFTTFERWPPSRALPYRGDSCPIVPELIVEVARPSDKAEDFLARMFVYLEAGAQAVWLVYPLSRAIYAYESPTEFRAFTAKDVLDGGTQLPGFQVPMSQLFPPMIPEPESSKSDDDE